MKKSKKPSVLAQLVPKLYTFMGSWWFFGSIVALFVLQAGWLALSMGYPQAFDEQYHLGIIQFFSHQLSPFISSQPTSADQYGPLLRTPSYLYHYLLSFPYRLLTHITTNQMTQVIVFRFVGIVLFIWGLLVYRKLLRKIGISRQMTHLSLAFVAFLPVMPLLAAQLNYDNLLFPMTGLCFIYMHKILRHIHEHKTLPLVPTVWFLVLSMLTSLVKYPFLPIFVATFLIITVAVVRQVRAWPEWTELFNSRVKNVLLIVFALLSLGLFFEKYGLNIVQYHTPIPECDQVLTVDRCQEYGPWARNFHAKDWNVQLKFADIAAYPYVWFKHIVWELIFAVSSYYDASGNISYHAGMQYIVVQYIAWIVVGVTVLLLLFYGGWLWRQKDLRPLLIASIVYVFALFGQNYWDFLQIGVAYAMHGRYLLPILPIVFAAIALLVAKAIRSLPRLATHDKTIATLLGMGVLVVFIVEGGGFTTFVLRSQPAWLRSDAGIQRINNDFKKILKPIVYDVQPPKTQITDK